MLRDLWTEIADRSQQRAQRQERIRRLDTELDWRSWFRHRLAAYWYGLLVLFLDVGVIATIVSLAAPPVTSVVYAVAIAFVIPAGYLEWEVYRVLWPADDEVLERLEREAEAVRAQRAAATVPPKNAAEDAPPTAERSPDPPET